MRAAVETAQAQVIAGRYRVERLLKRGLGVETLLARDLERGADVVLKTAPAAGLSAGARGRLEHEAACLRDLDGPHLTPLIDFGQDGDRFFLVVPFVPGEPLDVRLRAGPLAARDALAVARSLLAALAAAHARGVLHRDIKPANIIVAAGSGAGAPLMATLVDFGLARSAGLDASVRELPVGTVRYIAPEQAGLLAHGVDERSDLYSAGATLYECLAGRPAFAGETLGDVLRAHLGPRPPPSRTLGRETPRALDEVVARLLRIDPRERYASADSALADLDEIARALARGEVEPDVVAGARDRRRRALVEPAFVGRAEELAALDAEVARAASGRGRLVLLEAPSGGGKTRLLDELAGRAAARGAWVLRGEGADQAAPRPFQVLDGVVREVAAAAALEPGLASRIRAGLGPQLEAAVAALPELGRALGAGPAAASLGPEAHGEVRTLRALAALLDALGAPGRPAVVLLDDGQWANDLTFRLIADWSRAAVEAARAAPLHVAVVAAFRSEEVPAGHALRSLDPAPRLAIRPFDAHDTRRLAESMAGELPDGAVDLVHRASEGNPFLAAAVLHGLLETGALVASAGGWRVERDALGDVPISRRAAALLARRLERLPAPVLSFLSVGALLGKAFDVDLAAALAGADAAAVATPLAEARRRQIVWTDATLARAVFVHDRLREALLARIPDEERRRLHGLAAERIEAADRERVFDLAYHFDGAGDAARALPYALDAAERARARYALEVAERYYRIAERGAAGAGADRATRLRAVLGLADVLATRARYDEGAARYAEARDLCPDPVAKAEMDGRLGHLENKRGRMQASIEAIERGLALLGRPAPRSRLGFAARLGVEAVVQALHTLLPRLFVGRRPLERAGADLAAARLHHRLSIPYLMARGPIPSIWSHLCALNLAERYPPTPELGRAYAEHGWALAQALPNFERGRAYSARGLAICRELGDLADVGHGLSSLGYTLYSRARFAEALEVLLEADAASDRAGDLWERASGWFFRGNCLYRMGELRAAHELARRAYPVCAASATGAYQLYVLAKATGGRVPREWLEAELARGGDHMVFAQTALHVKADCRLAEGRTAEAVAALEEAERIVRRAGFRADLVTPIPIQLARALREEAARAPPHDARGRAALLARARKAAKRGLGLARTFRNNLPHALRELALVEAAGGASARRVRRRLDESLATAGRQGQRYERARTLAARAEAGRAFGWPGAAEDAAAARRLFAEIGAAEAEPRDAAPPAPASAGEPEAVTLSLADRFASVLVAGRRIATALARDDVLAALREAALGLLRAERCEVVDLGPDGAGAAGAVLRTAVERALAARRPVVLAGGRSALCAPVLAHGKPAAAFHVTHRQAGGLFGEDEVRIAGFIATIAGAALENASGLFANRLAEDEIRRLSAALSRDQEDERRRLSLALHDGAGQILAALGLRLEEVESAETAGGPAASRVAGARALADRIAEEVRRIAHDLRPAALDRLGLPDALVDLAGTFSTGPLEVVARVPPAAPGPAPSPEVGVALFRIAQEALSNVARHAGAGRALVTLERTPAALRLEVEDDGAGFDPASLDAGHGIGLVGMRERAAWIGGTFELDAGRGRGTRIRVEVPREPEREAIRA